MNVGDIRQRICSVVVMHRFSSRQYRSGIRSMPIIIMLCMQCLSVVNKGGEEDGK